MLVCRGGRAGGRHPSSFPRLSIHSFIHDPHTPLERQTVKTQVDKAPKMNPYLLAALGLIVSGCLSLMLVVPALIFFPVTIFFGIVSDRVAGLWSNGFGSVDCVGL